MAPLLAHHPLVESLPFVLPVLSMALGLVAMNVRDRMRRRRSGGSEG